MDTLTLMALMFLSHLQQFKLKHNKLTHSNSTGFMSCCSVLNKMKDEWELQVGNYYFVHCLGSKENLPLSLWFFNPENSCDRIIVKIFIYNVFLSLSFGTLINLPVRKIIFGWDFNVAIFNQFETLAEKNVVNIHSKLKTWFFCHSLSFYYVFNKKLSKWTFISLP